MNFDPSKIFRRCADSPTLKIANRGKDLIARGYDVVNVTVGEPDFAPPQTALDAMVAAASKSGSHRYGPAPGTAGLRSAVSERLKNELGLEMGDVMITHGGKGALFMGLFTITPKDHGITVMTTGPYWPSYRPIVEELGNQFIMVPTSATEGYKLPADKLRHFMDEHNPQAFILTSPGNPTSSVYNPDELDAFADVFREHPQCTIFSDDIYSYWVHGNQNFMNLSMVAPDLSDRIVICDAFSKSMALTGWRVGYAAGPKNLIAAMSANQGNYLGNPNSVGQIMAHAVLTGDQSYRNQWSKAFERRAARMVERLKNLDGIKLNMPGGGIYDYLDAEGLFAQNPTVPKDLPLFPGLEAEGFKSMAGQTLKDTGDFGNYLFGHFGLAAIPGTDCEDPNGMRMGIAVSDNDIEKASDRTIEGVMALERS